MGGVIAFLPPEPADAASPCTLVCTMDTKTGWCFGCARTLEEIAGWSSLSLETRRAILAELPARRDFFTREDKIK